MFCYGGYPGFLINTRTHKLCKGPSNTYSSNVCFQIVHWFQIGVIWKFFFLGSFKFVLRWWPSLISVQRNQNTISAGLFKYSLGAIKFIVTVIFCIFSQSTVKTLFGGGGHLGFPMAKKVFRESYKEHSYLLTFPSYMWLCIREEDFQPIRKHNWSQQPSLNSN